MADQGEGDGEHAPPLFWGKNKLSQKEGMPAGQTLRPPPPPPPHLIKLTTQAKQALHVVSNIIYNQMNKHQGLKTY